MRWFRRPPPPFEPYYELRLHERPQATGGTEWAWILDYYDGPDRRWLIGQNRAPTRDEAVAQGEAAKALHVRELAARHETIILA